MITDKYNEAGIPTEIEADGFITRAETLERINANKAKPATECAYPKCEDCDRYHGHYCTVPMVISKQFCRMLEEKIEQMTDDIYRLQKIVYDEIIGTKHRDTPQVETNFTWDDYLDGDKE